MELSPKKTLEAPAEEAAGAVLTPEETIPDGGWQAWLQVIGAFFLFFNSWAQVNSFGTYQTYYETVLLTSESSSNISWIGSVQSFLLLGSGAIVGPLFDAGYFTSLLVVGTSCISLGLMMTSLGTQYWHILLSQGFCAGLGYGCMVIPALAVLPQWFLRKRALVTGIAVCGASLGAVIYPLLFQNLLPKIGFGWSVRVIGFIAFTTCAFSASVMRTRCTARIVRSLFDPQAFREWPYIFYCLAMFCSNFGFFIPVFYLQSYAMSHGVTDMNIALNLVAILNGASTLGRLLPAHLAVHIGPVSTIMLITASTAIVTFSWIAVHTTAGNIIFAILWGMFSGGIVSLPMVVLASITADLKFLGARYGTSCLFNAVAGLCGAPLAGAILKTTGSYLGLQVFAGAMFSLTSIMFVCCRYAAVGKSMKSC